MANFLERYKNDQSLLEEERKKKKTSILNPNSSSYNEAKEETDFLSKYGASPSSSGASSSDDDFLSKYLSADTKSIYDEMAKLNASSQTETLQSESNGEKGLLQKIPYVSDIAGGGAEGLANIAKVGAEIRKSPLGVPIDFILNPLKAPSNFIKGAVNGLKNGDDLIESVKDGVSNVFEKNKEKGEKLVDVTDASIEYTKQYSSQNENDGFIAKTLKGTARSAGNMLASSIIPVPYLGVGLSSTGGAIKEGQDAGIDNPYLYGIMNGTIEAGSEMILPGSKVLKGINAGKGIKEAIKEVSKEFGEEALQQSLKTIGKTMLKEGAQEGLTEVAQGLAGNLFEAEDGSKMGFNSTEELLENILLAGASGALLGGVGDAGAYIKSKSTTTDSETGIKSSIFDSKKKKEAQEVAKKAIIQQQNEVDTLLSNIETKTTETGEEVYVAENGNTINPILMSKMNETYSETYGIDINESIELNNKLAENKAYEDEVLWNDYLNYAEIYDQQTEEIPSQTENLQSEEVVDENINPNIKSVEEKANTPVTNTDSNAEISPVEKTLNSNEEVVNETAKDTPKERTELLKILDNSINDESIAEIGFEKSIAEIDKALSVLPSSKESNELKDALTTKREEVLEKQRLYIEEQERIKAQKIKEAEEAKLAEEQRVLAEKQAKAEAKQKERERKAEEKAKEKARLQEERRIEREKIREQKRIEQERIKEENKIERERLREEKRIEKEKEKERLKKEKAEAKAKEKEAKLLEANKNKAKENENSEKDTKNAENKQNEQEKNSEKENLLNPKAKENKKDTEIQNSVLEEESLDNQNISKDTEDNQIEAKESKNNQNEDKNNESDNALTRDKFETDEDYESYISKREELIDSGYENIDIYDEVMKEETTKDALDRKEKALKKVTNSKEFKDHYGDLNLSIYNDESFNPSINSINNLAEALGKDVVFFKSDTDTSLKGFMSDNTMFINANDTNNGMMMTLGHETFHTLKNNNVEVFNELVKWGEENFTSDEIERFLSNVNNESLINEYMNNPSLLSEEMLAETLGNDFSNKEFWSRIQKKNKSLFEKIKDVISSIFDTLTGKDVDFLTKKHVHELRGKFVDIFGEFDNSSSLENTKTETLQSENDTNEVKFRDIAKTEEDKKVISLKVAKETFKAITNSLDDYRLREAINNTLEHRITSKGDLVKILNDGAIDVAFNTDFSYASRRGAIMEHLIRKHSFSVGDALAVANYITDLAEDTIMASNNIHGVPNHIAYKPKADETFEDKKMRVQAKFVDDIAAIKLVSDESYNLALLSRLNHGKIGNLFDSDVLVDMEGNEVLDYGWKTIDEDFKTGDSTEQIAYRNYLNFKSALERFRKGVPSLAKDDGTFYSYRELQFEIRNAELQYPRFIESSKRLYKFMDTFGQEYIVKTGLMSKGEFKLVRMSDPSWVPFVRDSDEGASFGYGRSKKGLANQKAAIERIKGSKDSVQDVYGSLVGYIEKTVTSSMKNKATQSIAHELLINPNLSEFGEVITNTNLVDLNDPKIITCMVDGQKVYLKIHNEHLLKSLTSLDEMEIHKMLKPLDKAVKIFKSLTTSDNPLFAFTNTFKDHFTYLVNSDTNIAKAEKYVAKAIKELATNGEIKQLYDKRGISGSHYTSGSINNKIERMQKQKHVYKDGKLVEITERNPVFKAFDKGLEGIEKLNYSSEAVHRLAKFMMSLDEGKSADQATLDAMEITTNFSRRGDYVKGMTLISPYFNAAIQGNVRKFNQFFTSKERTAQTLINIGIIKAISYALEYGLVGDDDKEKRKAISEYTRYSNYLIPVGNGKYLKIPKSREYGVMFDSIFEMIQDKGLGEGITTAVKMDYQNSAPDFQNFFLKPLLDTIGENDDATDFLGRDIMPYDLKGLPSNRQISEDTTIGSRIIGQLTSIAGISPVELDYLIDQYTGIVGDVYLNNGNPLKILGLLTNKVSVDSSVYSPNRTDYYNNKSLLEDALNIAEQDGDEKTIKAIEKINSEYTKTNKKAKKYLEKGDKEKSEALYEKLNEKYGDIIKQYKKGSKNINTSLILNPNSKS